MVDAFEKDDEIGVVAFDVRNYYKYDEIAVKEAEAKKEAAEGVEPAKYLLGFNGAGVGIRKIVMEQVGGYPEEFFLYWNEQDLAIRVMNAGYKIVEFPGIVSYHKYSPKNRDSQRGPFFYTRNLYWIIWKYYPVSKIVPYTIRLLFYSLFFTFTQGTFVYLKAAFSAFAFSHRAWKRRIKVKKEITKSLRIPFRLAFILYR